MPSTIQLHRPVVSLICLDRRDQRQNPDRRRALLRQDTRLFVSEKRGGQRTAGIRQLDGQLQVRRAQGAQPARGFHAPAGGTQVGVRLENGIYGHSRFYNTDFDDKLAC
ncbi:hypothetical protein LRN34_23430, partial [Enterobacter kobei]|nr:hypothetical protein [Enterobacter kobei]